MITNHPSVSALHTQTRWAAPRGHAPQAQVGQAWSSGPDQPLVRADRSAACQDQAAISNAEKILDAPCGVTVFAAGSSPHSHVLEGLNVSYALCGVTMFSTGDNLRMDVRTSRVSIRLVA